MHKSITVFEHQSLRLGMGGFEKIHLAALQHFLGERRDFPYYSLIHQGVKFNEYVGVIQVGNLMIEILPKADQGQDTDRWRRIFIGMLRASGIMDLPAPSSSRLKLKPNALLQLYFERYVRELERLLHRGLTKKYRKTEGNLNAVKGRIVFSKQMQYNLVHQERVYSAYSEFSREHLLHQVLLKALKLLANINSAPVLNSRIARLLTAFPEQVDVKVSASLFSRIMLNRSTQHYGPALQIARMLLLNFHPDVSRGQHDVLAILFDMNVLWERFVCKSLQRQLPRLIPACLVEAQEQREFWQSDGGKHLHIRPDIHIRIGDGGFYVIDTKWKNLDGRNPDIQDLRQMYVYHRYYHSEKVAMLYPGESDGYSGAFRALEYDAKVYSCTLMPVRVEDDILLMQQALAVKVAAWMSNK